MTSINTKKEIHKNWGNGVKYLKAIYFFNAESDGISLTTDEEGNGIIQLNKDCALWLAREIIKADKKIWSKKECDGDA